MAQKKNSKKDLEKRVAKLKKKVATLNKGLGKKHSELSRTVSSVQKKSDKLHKQKAPRKKLLRTTKDLASRLRNLEKSIAIVRRAGDELATRTSDLEARVASESDTPLRTDGEPDGSLQHGIELQRDRIQVVEEHLARLSAAQEGLELQIALLSREAEGGDGRAAHVEAGSSWAERTDELATRLKDIQGTVVRDTRDTVDLAERSHQLETSASELLQAEQALETRVSRLEQLSTELQERGRSGGGVDSGQQDPELQRQTSRAEEAADQLSQRTAALEAGQGSLAEQDARIASQLQAVETRLSELARSTAPAESVPAEAVRELEKQVALLSADRSSNLSRLEEFSRLAETFEKTGFDYTRHTDGLSDRITALSDGLEALTALDAERRLGELESRGQALERSLQVETEDLGELKQAEETLVQRLEMAISDAEMLEVRVEKLNSGSERLQDELDRLDSAIEQATKEAQQQHQRLQDQETRLGLHEQNLDAAVEDQNKVNDGIGARVANLDESGQALQEASDNLRVQQVRQDHETQALRQTLKRRTILGLLMLLLTAGGLIYLLLRGPVVPEGVQLAMQGDSSEDARVAVAAVADIERDMASIRSELSTLGDSLAQVARSVEEVDAVAAPGLPAQVMRLSEAVETLERQDLQRQQEAGELRTEQEQQQRDAAELRAEQEQFQAELERIGDEVESLGEKVSAAPAKSQAAPAGTGGWAQARAAGRYTVQLAGFHNPESLVRFKKIYGLGDGSAVYQTQFQGRAWHVVFHGDYASFAQALAAARQLPPELAAHKPWVRRLPPTGEILPL